MFPVSDIDIDVILRLRGAAGQREMHDAAANANADEMQM